MTAAGVRRASLVVVAVDGSRAALVARSASLIIYRAARVASRAAAVTAAGVFRASLVAVAVGGSRAAPVARSASPIIRLFLLSCTAGFCQVGIRTFAFIPLAKVAQIAVTPDAVIQAAGRPRPGQFNQVLSRACLKRLCRTSADRENTPLRCAGAQGGAAREDP